MCVGWKWIPGHEMFVFSTINVAITMLIFQSRSYKIPTLPLKCPFWQHFVLYIYWEVIFVVILIIIIEIYLKLI